MRSDNPSLFHRLAKDVLVRDVQRRFAFTWDLDKDGSHETTLARRYLEKAGVTSALPVLITANYQVPRALADGTGFPLGVWIPDRVFRQTFRDGRFNEELLSEFNDVGSLDGGCALGTVELPPAHVISADTPLIDLFDPAREHRLPRFVYDGFVCTGVVSERDLLSAPGRLCLLAMALELEEQATALCRTLSSQCFAQLPSGRQQKAMKVFMDRFGSANGNPDELKKLSEKMRMREMLSDRAEIKGPLASMAPLIPLLIECTTFIDKATMLCKCNLLLEASNGEVQRLFKRVEDLRNFCAHPSLESDDWSRSICEVRDLVPQVHRMTGIIAETQEREWRVRSKDRSVNEDGSAPDN